MQLDSGNVTTRNKDATSNKCTTTSNKGIATRSKDATRGSWMRAPKKGSMVYGGVPRVRAGCFWKHTQRTRHMLVETECPGFKSDLGRSNTALRVGQTDASGSFF